jgi:hypothetical protein
MRITKFIILILLFIKLSECIAGIVMADRRRRSGEQLMGLGACGTLESKILICVIRTSLPIPGGDRWKERRRCRPCFVLRAIPSAAQT